MVGDVLPGFKTCRPGDGRNRSFELRELPRAGKVVSLPVFEGKVFRREFDFTPVRRPLVLLPWERIGEPVCFVFENPRPRLSFWLESEPPRLLLVRFRVLPPLLLKRALDELLCFLKLEVDCFLKLDVV